MNTATMKKKNAYAHTGQTLKIFWRHAARYRRQVLVLAASILASTAMRVYTPLLYRDLINSISSGTPSSNFDQALTIVFFILGANFVLLILRRVLNFVDNYFMAHVMKDLTNTCYEYLQKHSLDFFNSHFIGSLVTKVKRFERSAEQIANQIIYDLGNSFLETGIIIVVLLWQYQTLGLIVLMWVVVFLVFSYVYAVLKLPYDIKRSEADTRTTGQLADSMTNNINTKLFGGYVRENKRFEDVTHEQYILRKKSWDLGSIGDSIQGVLMIFIEFLVMYLAVKNWQKGFFVVGDVVLIQIYTGRIFDKLWNTGRNIRTIFEAVADANEMTEMLLKPHAIQDAVGATVLKARAGAVEFKNVSFSYHTGVPVLKNFNLNIRAGERVAFVGPSGGGKSTIAKLLFRFYDIQRGEILIDGQNIAGVTQDSLRGAFAFVPQDPILFHRSLMENIRYARPGATDSEVIRAARLAHAHEFISAFPSGYDTLVGERGIKLSGGERQRVAIARAILKDSAVLVLDEATSSLDSESELYIQDALKKLMKGRTTLVIAHRLSTISQMDRIVVIENGAILEEGKHKELLKAKRGLYQKLWGIQAGSFASSSLPRPAR